MYVIPFQDYHFNEVIEISDDTKYNMVEGYSKYYDKGWLYKNDDDYYHFILKGIKPGLNYILCSYTDVHGYMVDFISTDKQEVIDYFNRIFNFGSGEELMENYYIEDDWAFNGEALIIEYECKGE